MVMIKIRPGFDKTRIGFWKYIFVSARQVSGQAFIIKASGRRLSALKWPFSKPESLVAAEIVVYLLVNLFWEK